MLRQLVIMLLALTNLPNAAAKDEVLCNGNAKLKQYEGLWVWPKLNAALQKSRSWNTALMQVDTQISSVFVQDQKVAVSFNWHEGDDSGNCIRVNAGKVWVQINHQAKKWQGPLIATPVRDLEQEGAYYLSQFFTGCYHSDNNERWCLSPTEITIGSEKIPAKLQMDRSEMPDYGTPIAVEGKNLPFLIFVPRKQGWAVFQDDWASSETRVPVDPDKSKPWHILSK